MTLAAGVTGPLELILWALAGAVLPLPPLVPTDSPAETVAPPGSAEPVALSAPAARAIALLRASRLPDAPPTEEIVALLGAEAEAALAELVGMLVRCRVPGLPDDPQEQTLSRPQREMTLAALSGISRGRVRAEAEKLVAPGSEPRALAAGLRLLAVAGSAADVAALVVHATPESEEPVHEEVLEAFEWGVARLLRADADGFEGAAEVLRERVHPLMPALARAIGATRDPRGLRLLLEITTCDEGIAPIAIAQVRHVGPSTDESVNRAFAERLRGDLESVEPGRCGAAAAALAELGDFEALPTFLQLLEHPALGRDAQWALGRLTGLQFQDPERWRRWYASETEWFEREYPRLLHDLHAQHLARRLAAVREISAHRLRRHELAEELARAALEGPAQACVPTCVGLASLGSDRALGALVAILETDPDKRCRAEARCALVAITGEDHGEEPGPWRAAYGHRIEPAAR